MKRFLFVLATGSALLFGACDKDDAQGDLDIAENLQNIGSNVILRTYEDLKDKAAALQAACATLQNNPSQANLGIARNVWAAARSPWEQSEGFLFGPVDQEGLDPSIDSWPVNVVDLNNVLASGNALTPVFLANQEGTLKGFHTIEYLLWGESGQKQVGAFTAREFEYLAACAEVLANDAAQLYNLWSPNSGKYINNLLNAGQSGSIYISRKSALEELVNALIVIADEVGNGKIDEPLSTQDLTLEESRFSANSKADFSDNIRSIRNIYTGVYLAWGTQKGISGIIREKNAALDDRVKAEIDAAIAAIAAIPGTFTDAVVNQPAAVAAAQTSVRTLQETLESQVLPLVNEL